MTRADVRYETAETASEADIEAVDTGLHLYNLEAADLGAMQPLFCFARERGGTTTRLDTFGLQAPALYERNGYEVVCRFDGFPDGIVKCVMQRRLDRRQVQR